MRMQLAIRPTHILMFVAVMAVWSFNFVVVKWAVAAFPPLFFVALRFAIVSLSLVPFVQRPRGRQWRGLFLVSLTLGVLHFACMFNGMVLTPASTAALIQQLQVPLAAILAAAFLGDRLGWRRIVGMALTFVGAVIILGEPDLTAPLWSQGLILAAGFFWAVSTIQIKQLKGIPAMTLNAWIALLAVPQLLFVSWLFEEGQRAALAAIDWQGILVVLYNSVFIVLIGYGTWYHLLKRYDVNQAMPFTLLMPPMGVLFGALFLDEPLGWTLLVGGLVTLAGVALIVLTRPPSAVPEA